MTVSDTWSVQNLDNKYDVIYTNSAKKKCFPLR